MDPDLDLNRPSRVRILGSNGRLWIGIGAAFALLLIVPATSWIVAQQASWLFGPPQSLKVALATIGINIPDAVLGASQNFKEIDRIAGLRPNDYSTQAAWALESPSTTTSIDRLESLTARFPHHAATYAHILRFETISEIRVSRPVEEILESQTIPDPISQSAPPDSAAFSMFDSAAVQGEVVDPSNAYFPFMRATGLFAVGRDTAAIAAIMRAGKATSWNDYTSDEAEDRWRLNGVPSGGRDALLKLAVQESVFYPHLATLRSVARIATAAAVQDESAGDTAGGLAIRTALMHLGSLMRAQSSSAIGSLVGIAIVATAMERPGGSPPLMTQTGRTADQQLQESEAQYCAYLRSIGRTDQIGWVTTEIAADRQARADIVAGASGSGPLGRPLAVVLLMWIVGAAALSLGVWCALNALAAWAVAHRAGQWQVLVAISIVGSCASVWLVLCCLRAAGLAVDAGGWVGFGQGGTWDQLPTLLQTDIGWPTALAALVPICALGYFLYSAAFRRIGGAKIAAGSMRLAGVVMAIYAVLVVITVFQDARVITMSDQSVRHEGQFMAEQVGKTWPD